MTEIVQNAPKIDKIGPTRVGLVVTTLLSSEADLGMLQHPR